MGYTYEEIREKCSQAISEVEIFYTQGFVNYIGNIVDSKVPYTEVVAEFVLENIEVFRDIKPIHREQSYCQNHTGEFNYDSNRTEELDAMRMFNQCRDGSSVGKAGKIIDYQIPLKGKKSDKAGKIDLLSENNDAVYVLELKKEDSKETLLRCVLEGYTYLKTVDKEKLYREYSEISNKSLPLRTAPFVYENGAQWKEYNELVNGKRPMLEKLMKELGEDVPIVPFFIRKIYLYSSI